MTVGDLIALLKTFPEDAIVIRTYCSDYDDVTAEQIKLFDPGVVLRNGRYMKYERKWWPDNEPPAFLKAVHFAGN